MDRLYWCAKHYGIVWDLMGRIRQVPEVYSSFEHIVAAGLRQAGNMPIQGLAAGVFKIAMAKLEQCFSALRADGIWVNAILPVHDELIVEVEQKYAEEVQGIMTREMNASMNYLGSGECALKVPVLSDGNIMDRWTKKD
jgi:DNA polymerase-1